MVGERRLLDPGNGAELDLKTRVESENLGLFVSCLSRIHAEEQHVFAIQFEFDRLQVRKRTDKQPRRQEHHQRLANLCQQQ